MDDEKETKPADRRTYFKTFEIPEEVLDNILFRFMHNLPDHEVSILTTVIGGLA